ncbi:MAG: hypothetical protein ACRDP9_03935 [Kribbellaceae bacterium]
MLALWCASTFGDVDGYESWETRVNERLGAAISRGELVPVGIQSDGAFGVRVAVAPDGLTEREQRYAIVASEPYLLTVRGGEVCLSGIENVGSPEHATLRMPLMDRRYTVHVTLVGWDEEPGGANPDGTPTESALADFVVAIAPARGSETYRDKEATFDRPG